MHAWQNDSSHDILIVIGPFTWSIPGYFVKGIHHPAQALFCIVPAIHIGVKPSLRFLFTELWCGYVFGQ